MNIVLNGKPFTVEKDMSLSAIVKVRGADPKVVVLELNREIVSSEVWDSIVLKENDELEIISFVGGG